MDGHSGLDAGKVSFGHQHPSPWTSQLCPGAGRSRWVLLRELEAPALPAVYAISSRGTLLYIGSTDQLARRLRRHGIQPARTHGRFSFKEHADVDVRFSLSLRSGDWLAREHRLIARLRPILNARIPRHRS